MGIGPAEAACGVPALVRRATACLMVLAMLLLSAGAVRRAPFSYCGLGGQALRSAPER
jgi:hypothetical protein